MRKSLLYVFDNHMQATSSCSATRVCFLIAITPPPPPEHEKIGRAPGALPIVFCGGGGEGVYMYRLNVGKK